MNREQLLEKFAQPIPVLEGGFVRLVDVMGDDSSIVQAARISYGKGTKSVNEDRGLIRYLMRHRHTTPFEMCEIKFHIRAPMDVVRQWIRHRTANVNEYSTRYSEAIDETHATKPGEWRLQSTTNKQGSGGYVDLAVGQELTEMEEVFHQLARQLYQDRLEAGVAREQARKDLPLSTYTEFYWKIDLHNLLHFLGLRMDSHAQLEIRLFANAMAEVVKEWCPLAWEAFEDYRLNAVTLSRWELHVVRQLVAEAIGMYTIASIMKGQSTQEFVVQEFDPDGKLSKRELQELWSKLDLGD